MARCFDYGADTKPTTDGIAAAAGGSTHGSKRGSLFRSVFNRRLILPPPLPFVPHPTLCYASLLSSSLGIAGRTV